MGLVGGDHSVPLGLIRAVAERNPGVGVLHVDAHADLRRAYEGFTYSHASIMYNVLNEAAGVSALVQVGVRDLCDDEARLASADARVRLFDDYALSAAKFGGESWNAVCDRIIACLPEKAYVSFDIDGLAPEYCPHTGTPVPGGLSR
ncbi:MAG: arginase family protein [Alistipes sp.]